MELIVITEQLVEEEIDRPTEERDEAAVGGERGAD